MPNHSAPRPADQPAPDARERTPVELYVHVHQGACGHLWRFLPKCPVCPTLDARYREAAEKIRHTYHAAGCEFHQLSMNIGKVCPDPKHEVPCAHCEERVGAILAELGGAE